MITSLSLYDLSTEAAEIGEILWEWTVDRNSNVMYRIAIRAGVLKGKYSSNQFDFCIHKLLRKRDVFPKDQLVALRKAV